MLRNRQDAEDVVQQAALRGWERFATYQVGRPFTGWWFAILRNCCIDLLRRRRTEPVDLRESGDRAEIPSSDTMAWESLRVAMDQLSNEHRDILRLRYFADLSYRELAEALSIPEGTVMSRLHMARRALAARMPTEDP